MATNRFGVAIGNFDKVSSIPITDNPLEMERIGRKIFADNPRVYTERLKEVINRNVEKFLANVEPKKKENAFYRSIYDYWVYGANIIEEFVFNFLEKSHEEKSKYMVQRVCRFYFDHINDDEETVRLFSNKYNTYKFFKKYYHREAVLVSGEEDYENFLEFVKKHSEFAIKPVDLGIGLYIRKDSIKNYQSPRELFDKLLAERRFIKEDIGTRNIYLHLKKDVDIILEELIIADPKMLKLNPSSVNSVRITTFRLPDRVHIFNTFIKIGVNGEFADNGGHGGFLAGINEKTGIIDTDLFNENEYRITPLERHPDTNLKVRGFQIPRWDEVISLAKEVASKPEKVNYVGWDFALTKNGWVVIEGNGHGDTIGPQILYGKGVKKDLEELIGWKFDKEFWWQ